MEHILDEVLLSDNVVECFFDYYNGDKGFKSWLLSCLPEIEDCRCLKQDNPWHIYNCLEHILRSVEEMNKQTINLNVKERKMLAYTMFLHDIGKPECYIRRYSKLYGKEVDSFFNHNIASKRIAEGFLPNCSFSELELDIIKTLIDKHDIFMFITLDDDNNKHHRVLTSEYLNEIITELNTVYDGDIMLNYLIMVGRADNKAQNPKMTNNSLLLLDKMSEMLGEYQKSIL